MKRLSLVLVCVVASVGCPGEGILPPQVPSLASKPKPPEELDLRPSATGLGFRLSNAEPERPAVHVEPKSSMLTQAETEALLKRLPPLTPDAALTSDFAFRERSAPVPRPGKTELAAFPPVQNGGPPPNVTSGPLTVLRKMPVGVLAQAPLVSVTFSEPMIPITSHAELGKLSVPVTLTPEPKGTWQWAGTQTLVFKPEGQFPKATDYVVDIPAGIKSQRGSVLAQGERFTFSLPTAKLQSFTPTGPGIETAPLMTAVFDQAVDPASVLSLTRATSGADTFALRLATDEETKASETYKNVTHNVPPERVVAFKPVKPLPKSAQIIVAFQSGLPSLEGPKRAKETQSNAFRTYDALTRKTATCGGDEGCRPGDTYYITFNNELDEQAFDPSMVKVSPMLDSMRISTNANTLAISGLNKGRTTFTVTLSPEIRDTFGQSLGRSEELTVKVGAALPALFAEHRDLEVLDPKAKAQYPIFSVNEGPLKYALYSVTPEQYQAYEQYRNKWNYDGVPAAPPGKLVKSGTITPKGEADALVQTALDLSPALRNGLGHVIVVVESQRPFKERWQKQWVRTWVQATNLGLTMLSDPSSRQGWVTGLVDGKPISGATVRTLPGGDAATTNSDGLARLGTMQSVVTTVAELGGDSTFIAGSLAMPHSPSTIRTFSFTDRHMYKPTEEVHVRGWIRDVDMSPRGDVSHAQLASPLPYRVRDARGIEIAKGTFPLNESGGFDLSFKLPDKANTGPAHIEFNSGTGYLAFEVEEFRRPEFEVGLATEGGPYYVGRHAIATASAKYYAGGGLAGAKTEWSVTKKEAHFTPPKHETFRFGNDEWHPYWYDSFEMGGSFGRHGSRMAQKSTSETWKAETDAQGEHRLRLDFDVLDPSYALELDLNATVTDLNRQAWSASGHMLVHPAEVYVGLRAERAFVAAGQAFDLAVVAADIDGNHVPGRTIRVHGARIEYAREKGKNVETEKDIADCELVSTTEVAKCSLKTGAAGTYRITAIVTDAAGRKSQTRFSTWVTGKEDVPSLARTRDDRVELVADRTSYAPGDTANILIRAPFAPAEGLVIVDRQGVVSTQRIHINQASESIAVPTSDALLPNVTVKVVLVGATTRRNAKGEPDPSLPLQVARASGEVALKIPPKSRTLSVKASTPESSVDPGAKTTIDVEVRGPSGTPVANADVALYVVDEAVLALSGYKTPDPLTAFYGERYPGASIVDQREYVFLPDPAMGGLGLSGTGQGGGGVSDPMAYLGKAETTGAPRPMASAISDAKSKPVARKRSTDKGETANEPNKASPIAMRSDLRALALWAPHLKTDGQGRAQTSVKLPDSTTRYRIMAIAAEGEKNFGSGDASLTTRLPLIVRASPPRFLNYGDSFDLSLTLQNQTKSPMSVSVATRADNAVVPGVGKRVEVPANDRVEVRFPASAKLPGKARFQAAVSAAAAADAAMFELPVWTPATTEAFATYGVIDGGSIAQAVKAPGGVAPGFGGLEITTSSTALFTLGDAFLYLVQYPFDCNEQIASRLLSIVALKDVLRAFNPEGLPSEKNLAETIEEDLRRLKVRQHWTGGWGFWAGEEWPYLSIHVAHALARAAERGYAVDAQMYARSKQYLRSIDNHIPKYYGDEARRALVAYALYVRAHMGDADIARVRSLVSQSGGIEKMPLESLGWIWPTLTAANAPERVAIQKHLANRVTETAGAAHFVTSYGDGSYLMLHSDRRADAILLEGMIGDDPRNALIPKLVTGLLGHRTQGHWQSTQESSFVLLSLDRYFRAFENVSPDFVARAWLGDKYAGERNYKGYNTDRQEIRIPMRQLAAMGSGDLTLQKEGAGRLYYRLGMQYAPADLKADPMDRGFTVTRTYEPANKDAVVTRDAAGVWHVKAGSTVRVRVTMVTQARRHHVALVDPMPAGFEPMNASLAVTGPIPQDEKAPKTDWWARSWYEHQNLRDERAEAFTSLLWDGVHEYVYTARATTPGTFVVPPPKAEEMYSPEVFGRGASATLKVE